MADSSTRRPASRTTRVAGSSESSPTESSPRRAPAVAAAQQRAHPRQQLRVEERLAEVVVGPAREAANPVGVAGAAAQHDHREVGVDRRPGRRRRARGRAGEAAAVREAQVEHHQRRLAHLDGPQALPRPGAGHAEAVGGEVVEQEGPRGLVVLDHQDQALLVLTLRRRPEKDETRPGRPRKTDLTVRCSSLRRHADRSSFCCRPQQRVEGARLPKGVCASEQRSGVAADRRAEALELA